MADETTATDWRLWLAGGSLLVAVGTFFYSRHHRIKSEDRDKKIRESTYYLSEIDEIRAPVQKGVEQLHIIIRQLDKLLINPPANADQQDLFVVELLNNFVEGQTQIEIVLRRLDEYDRIIRHDWTELFQPIIQDTLSKEIMQLRQELLENDWQISAGAKQASTTIKSIINQFETELLARLRAERRKLMQL